VAPSPKIEPEDYSLKCGELPTIVIVWWRKYKVVCHSSGSYTQRALRWPSKGSMNATQAHKQYLHSHDVGARQFNSIDLPLLPPDFA
jgi:hypothetical protein